MEKTVIKPFCRGQSAGNRLSSFPFSLNLFSERLSFQTTVDCVTLTSQLLLFQRRIHGRRRHRLINGRKEQCDVLLKFTLVCTRWGSSETGRKKFTCHRPMPRLPQNDLEFGSFLAGLIDSEGHFNNIPQLVISFHANDSHLAYFLKSSIGYGKVTKKKVNSKSALVYVCAHTLGLIRIAQLVHNQLRHHTKIQQYNERLLQSDLLLLKKEKKRNKSAKNSSHLLSTITPTQSILSHYWLAGFIAGDGSFQFKVIDRLQQQTRLGMNPTAVTAVTAVRKRLPEIRVTLQIDQKDDLLLKQIQANLGGYIGYRKSQDTYYYSSVSFTNATKWIHYLDHTHLIGAKMTQYVLWRRVCLLIQQRRHLTLDGIRVIRAIVQRISKLKQHVN